MERRYHIDIILHLLSDHMDVLSFIMDNWPRDGEGKRIAFEPSELPPEARKIVMDALFGSSEEAMARSNPYQGVTIDSKRKSYLPVDITPHTQPKKRVPPAYIRREDAIHEYQSHLPPLEIPGESGDQKKHSFENLFEETRAEQEDLLTLEAKQRRQEALDRISTRDEKAEAKRQARQSKGKFRTETPEDK